MACASSSVQSGHGPQAWLLDKSTRLHLQHGPIDLLVDAKGSSTDVQRAFEQAFVAFGNILDILAAQLPLLRKAYTPQNDREFIGPVAHRMKEAIEPYTEFNITPMIAVAGAVADHVLSNMVLECDLLRAQVNNGGDIALYLNGESELRIGVCTNPESTLHEDVITLKSEYGVGGVATSGWKGRSHSLGIADAVTVLAPTAAAADVAATLIANAVDLPNSDLVLRTPANQLESDTDLGDRLVTVNVSILSTLEKKQALDSGELCARRIMEKGHINCCYLHIQGLTRLVGATTFHHLFPTDNHHVNG
ncbi:MAG: ApbE superfamily uncharacterized protein (UPF0280 family) [Granulosicoccus sp.]|jgi:ApbE superfamily uncharacterized protein (UPF0280 family)